jgi:hypothetical protein
MSYYFITKIQEKKGMKTEKKRIFGESDDEVVFLVLEIFFEEQVQFKISI